MDLLRNACFLPLCFFLVIGLYSCYTDIKNRRIKNWLISVGIFTGILLYLFSSQIIIQNILFLNLAIGIFTALILWRTNIWAAGDSKFYIFSSIFAPLLIPPNVFHRSSAGIPLVLVVLGNAFIIGLVYILLETVVTFFQKLYQHWQQRGLSKLASIFMGRFRNVDFLLSQLKIIFFYLGTIIIFSVLSRYIYRAVSFMPKGHFILYLILLLIYTPVSKLLGKIKISYLSLALILLILLFRINILPIFETAFKFFVILGAMRIFINWSIQRKETRIIRPEEIKPYILLAKEEIVSLPQEMQPKIRFFSDGLTPEQAGQLKLYFQTENREDIKIYNTFPFVPFIVIGVLITCLLEGRLINILFFLY